MNKPIIDVCCGGRMFHSNKNNPNVIFMDKREFCEELCDGREFEVKPDIVADFRNITFSDNSFYTVIFDPPHLWNISDKAFMARKYGRLNKDTWQIDIKQGFEECMRILKPNGTLIFKWSCRDITLGKLLEAIQTKPLISHQNNRTFFLVFTKVVQA